jgi:hypothetical protein
MVIIDKNSIIKRYKAMEAMEAMEAMAMAMKGLIVQ